VSEVDGTGWRERSFRPVPVPWLVVVRGSVLVRVFRTRGGGKPQVQTGWLSACQTGGERNQSEKAKLEAQKPGVRGLKRARCYRGDRKRTLSAG